MSAGRLILGHDEITRVMVLVTFSNAVRDHLVHDCQLNWFYGLNNRV